MILRHFLFFLVFVPFLINGQDLGDISEDENTAHFSDVGKGRMSWIVEDQTTPWIGSYRFLASSISHSTVLISVVDSSTGKKLAECTTNGTSESQKSSEIPIWNKFVWTLNQNSLECQIGEKNAEIINLEPSAHPRSFSIRILAIKGPRCFKDLIVQNEQPNGCPPILRRNTFSAHNFECGCPKSIIDKWITPESTEETKKMPTSKEIKQNVPQFPLFSIAENETQPTFTLLPNNQLSSSLSTQEFKFTAHACVGYECKNNGTCVLDIHSKPNCFCPDGFAGNRCEIDLCAQIDCKNGGFCQIKNGAAICQCPVGTVGIFCEKIICPNDCLNGGICEFMNEIPACHCADGFIGPNCNVKDNCRENSACAVFGESATCTTNPTSFAMITDSLMDSNYTCQCVDDQGHWTDCLSLALLKQEMTTHKPRTFPTSPIESSNQPVVVPSIKPIGPPGTSQIWTEKPDLEPRGPPSVEEEITDEPEPVFPLTTPENVKESTTMSSTLPSTTEIIEDETQTETETPILFTILSTTTRQVTTTTVPTTTSTTPSTTTTTMTTTILTTTTTPVLMTEIPPGVGDEDEIRGDNGFETITQISSESSKVETTTKHGSLWTLPNSNENSIIDEKENNKTAPTKSTEKTEEHQTEHERSATKSEASWLSWSVAIVAIIVLLGLIAVTTLFVIRYVRRSRRLHGKYNPAREENAVTSTYAMPMTTVSKQERLI